MKTTWMKPLFVIAGLYDAVLAIAFLFWASRIFQWYGVTPPNHFGYVKFPALLLLIFAAMFFRIASDPVKNRGLIIYGIGLKLAYCGTAFWYQVRGDIPSMWMPWAWADLVFLLLFVIAWKSTASARD